MPNTQPTNQSHLNVIEADALPASATDQIIFKHFMACLLDIAKNESNDLAVFHLNRAIEFYTQNK